MADEIKRTDQQTAIEFAASLEQTSSSMESALSKLNEMAQALNNFISTLSRNISTFKDEANSFTGILNPLNSAVNDTINEFGKLDEIDSEVFSKLQTSATLAKETIDQISQEILAQLEKLSDNNLNSVLGELSSLDIFRDKVIEIITQVSSIKSSFEEVKTSVSDIQTAIDTLTLEKFAKELADVQTFLTTDIQRAIIEIRTNLASLNKGTNDSSVLFESFNELFGLLGNLGENIGVIDTKLDELSNKEVKFDKIEQSIQNLELSFNAVFEKFKSNNKNIKNFGELAGNVGALGGSVEVLAAAATKLSVDGDKLVSILNSISKININGENIQATNFVQKVEQIFNLLKEDSLTKLDPTRIETLVNDLNTSLKTLEFPSNMDQVSIRISQFAESIQNLSRSSTIETGTNITKRVNSIRALLDSIRDLGQVPKRLEELSGIAESLKAINDGFANFNVDDGKLEVLTKLRTIVQSFSKGEGFSGDTTRELPNHFNKIGTALSNLAPGVEQFTKAVSLDDLNLDRYENLAGAIDNIALALNRLRNPGTSTESGNKDLSVSFNELEIALGNVNDTLSPVTDIAERINTLSQVVATLEDALKKIQTMNQTGVSSDNLNSTLKTFVAAVNELNSFSVGNIASANTNLNILTESFERLQKAMAAYEKIYTNINNLPEFSMNIKAHFEALTNTLVEVNELLDAFINDSSELDRSTENFTKLAGAMKQVESVMKSFKKLTESAGTVLDTDAITAQFESLESVFTTLNSAMNKMKGGREDFAAFTAELKEMRTVIATIEKAMGSLAEMSNHGFNTNYVTDLNREVQDLASILINAETSLSGFSMSSQQIGDLVVGIRELNKLLTQMQNLTENAQRGMSVNVVDMQQYFTDLMNCVETLVDRVNALNISSANVSTLTELLNSLTAGFRAAGSGARSFGGSVTSAGTQTVMYTAQTNAATVAVANFHAMFANRGAISGANQILQSLSKLRFGVQGLIFAMGGKTIWNWTVGQNSEMELIARSLEMIFNNAAKAKQTILDLRNYAALTVFDMPEVLNAGQSFASARMDVNKWVRIAGDLASAKKSIGIELEDVANVIIRINSGDFGRATMRLRQMGISLSDLRAQGLEFSKSNQYMGNTEQYLIALERIINQRFGGLTLSMSSTFSGMLNNLKDTLQIMGMRFGDEAFAYAKDALYDFNEFMQEFQYTDTFKNLREEFNKIIEMAIAFGKTFGPPILKILEFIGKHASAIFALIEVNVVKAFFTSILNGIMGVAGWFQNLVITNALIKTQIGEQVALINAGLVANGKQALALKTINTLLAENLAKQMAIVQMQKLGRALTEAEAAAVATQALFQVGAKVGGNAITNALSGAGGAAVANAVAAGGTSSKIAKDALDATAPATGAILASTGLLSKLAAKVGPFVQAIVSKIGVIGGVLLKALGIGAAIIAGIRIAVSIFEKMHKGTVKWSESVEELNRKLGQQQEEIKKVESLNTARLSALSRIEAYNREETKIVATLGKGVEAEQALHRVQTLRAATEEQLRRLTQDLIRVYPELHNVYYDGTILGMEYNKMLEKQSELLAEVQERKSREFGEAYQQRVKQAEFEKRELENDLVRAQKLANLASQTEKSGVQKFLVGLTAGASKLVNFLVNSSYWKDVIEEMDIVSMPAEKLLSVFNEQNRNIREIMTNIQGQSDIMNDFDKFLDFIKNRGAYQTSTGAWKIDSGLFSLKDGTLDWAAAVEAFEKQNADFLAYVEKMVNFPERFKDITDSTETVIKRLEQQMNIELARLEVSGVAKDAKQYIDTNIKFLKMMEEVYVDATKSIEQIRDEEVANLIKNANLIPDAIKELILEGFDAEDLVEIMRYGIESWDKPLTEALKAKLQVIYDLLSKDISTYGVKNAAEVLEQGYTQWEDILALSRLTQASQEELWNLEEKYWDTKRKAIQSDTKNSESAYQQLVRLNDHRRQISEALRDIRLQEVELAGVAKDSAQYVAVQRQENFQIRDLILDYLGQLRNLIPSITDPQEKMRAELQALQLQRDANALLLEIRNNTATSVGEFNAPGSLRAMTFYDYRVLGGRGDNVRSFEIGNANFAINVQQLQDIGDVANMMGLIQQWLGNLMRNREAEYPFHVRLHSWGNT